MPDSFAGFAGYVTLSLSRQSMSSYPQRVRDNILPLSVGSTLPEAFEEWSFTEQTGDHGEPIETCQLCEQEDLRYHFEIRNSLTGHTLWVGSQCILKFGVSVFEGGRKLSESDSRKKLDRLMQQMRLESCVRALESLAAKEKNAILSNALDYYRNRAIAFTPEPANPRVMPCNWGCGQRFCGDFAGCV